MFWVLPYLNGKRGDSLIEQRGDVPLSSGFIKYEENRVVKFESQKMVTIKGQRETLDITILKKARMRHQTCYKTSGFIYVFSHKVTEHNLVYPFFWFYEQWWNVNPFGSVPYPFTEVTARFISDPYDCLDFQR